MVTPPASRRARAPATVERIVHSRIPARPAQSQPATEPRRRRASPAWRIEIDGRERRGDSWPHKPCVSEITPDHVYAGAMSDRSSRRASSSCAASPSRDSSRRSSCCRRRRSASRNWAARRSPRAVPRFLTYASTASAPLTGGCRPHGRGTLHRQQRTCCARSATASRPASRELALLPSRRLRRDCSRRGRRPDPSAARAQARRGDRLWGLTSVADRVAPSIASDQAHGR